MLSGPDRQPKVTSVDDVTGARDLKRLSQVSRLFCFAHLAPMQPQSLKQQRG